MTRSDLQAALDLAARTAGVVGSQLSVALGDEVIDLAQGLANAERHEPMRVETVGQIGSITKLFNAALIVSLATEGLLSLDRPISTYAARLELAGGAEREISLRQLLSMSAGLDNGPYTVRDGGDDTLAAYAHSLRDIALLYRPGAGFGYSNAGSCVAGYAAQAALGTPWEELVRARVFEPCGLTQWSLGADDSAFHPLSVGHVAPATVGAAAVVIRPWGYSRAQAPAGSSLAMSIRDLARFGRHLAGGQPADGRAGLAANAIAAMMVPTSTVPSPIPSFAIGDAWGLGPSRCRWGTLDVWGHAGGMRSARSLLCWMPSVRGTIAFSTNTPASFPAFATMIFRDVAARVFAAAPEVGREPPAWSARVDDDLDRFVGTYERFGTRYVLTVCDGRLHYREENLGVALPNEVIGPTADCDCLRVGEGEFQIIVPGFAEPLPLTFSGHDANGRRATALVSTIFPARLVRS